MRPGIGQVRTVDLAVAGDDGGPRGRARRRKDRDEEKPLVPVPPHAQEIAGRTS